MTFSQPAAGGDQFDPKDHNGRLVIVYPKSFNAETPTAHGIAPSTDADIVVVDAAGADGRPPYFQNARLFGNLAKSVSRDLGGQVLGRIGQVPTQKGNPAWVLQNFTDQDAAMAVPVDAAYKAGQFKQADNPMQQAAPPAQQWQGAPAPAAPAGYAGGPTTPPAAPAAAAQQQWQPPAPAASPAQQWTAPAPAAPAPATSPAGAQQWSPPQQSAPAPAAPPAPAAAAPAAVDPALVQYLAERGIHGPFPDQATAEAIAASLQG